MIDIFGKNLDSLKDKKLWLFDMDGTIYSEDSIFDGTLELLDKISANGAKYIFITNNSSKSVYDYVEKVTKMGIKADKENFFTSSQATILMLKEKHNGAKVFCMGTKSLIRELQEAEITITEDVEPDIDVILMGFDTELTSQKLRNICENLLKDVPYYATNPDLVCPVSFGYVPDCGSVAIMLKNATGKTPVFIGKPEPTMINIARQKFGCSKEETVVVGDRLYTDIASGVNAEVDTICVLSGEATLDDVKNSPVKPEYVINSVKDLAKELF